MSNPYSTQAISGYNASPPPDDGSATDANVLKWSNHKTKLADPLKTLAEAINAQTLTAFGNIFGNSHSTKATHYTVIASDIGTFIEVTAAANISLLPVSTAGQGFPLAIINTGSGVVTIDPNSTELINGALTATLQPDEWTILTCDGASWLAIGDATDTREVEKFRVSTVTKANDTSVGADTELADISLSTSSSYRVDGFLKCNQNVGNLSFGLLVTQAIFADSSAIMWEAEDESGVRATGFEKNISTIIPVTTMTDGEDFIVKFRAMFFTAGSSGSTLSVRWAQETSSANPTSLYLGSWLQAKRIS